MGNDEATFCGKLIRSKIDSCQSRDRRITIVQLVINHEETLTKLAESLASIAETLPRMDIHLSLYPTAMMKRNVEELYALLIKFYHRTLRWYSAGPLKHLVKSLTRPYSLEFADILRQMDTRARLIDSLAIAMAHDELRAMFNLLSGGLEEQKRFRDEFANIWPTLAQMQDAQSQTGKQIESVRELIICKPLFHQLAPREI